MYTQSSSLLWGTFILIFSGCCFNLLEQGPTPEQYGPKNGLETTTYSNGSPNMTATFADGILSGEVRSWYPDGQLRYIREYRAGKRVGLETVYYPDGNLYRKGNIDQGDYKIYHPNGQMQVFNDSIASDGTHYYLRWNSAGVLIESVPLVDGKENGLHQFWSAKGVLMAKGMETAGLRTGLWEHYGESGGLLESHDYGDGSPLQQQQFAIINGTVPNYRHDGISYLAENDNAMGEQVGVLDWPCTDDYYTLYIDESINEPKPVNMGDVSRLIGYPVIARDAGVQGNVVVRMLIGRDGIPIDNKVITLISPLLSNEVEFYLMDLRFIAATVNDEPTPFWVNIPFNFKLIK
ncbi:MAG: energy transducer TonB [Bacteroidia bacterium]